MSAISRTWVPTSYFINVGYVSKEKEMRARTDAGPPKRGQPGSACCNCCALFDSELKTGHEAPVNAKREPSFIVAFTLFFRGNRGVVLDSGFETRMQTQGNRITRKESGVSSCRNLGVQPSSAVITRLPRPAFQHLTLSL